MELSLTVSLLKEAHFFSQMQCKVLMLYEMVFIFISRHHISISHLLGMLGPLDLLFKV